MLDTSSHIIYSHVIFALKNSRYDLEQVKRKKVVGFIAPTYPFLEGKEEEILIEVLSKTASELNISLAALNFCGDHVHAIIVSETSDQSKSMMLWKGKTAYIYNKLVNPFINSSGSVKSDGTKQQLWAKSYFQRILKSKEEIQNVIHYVNYNRQKHHLPKLSDSTIEIIKILTNQSITDGFTRRQT